MEKRKFRTSAHFHAKTTDYAAGLIILRAVRQCRPGVGIFHLTYFCSSVRLSPSMMLVITHISWLFLLFWQETVLCSDDCNFQSRFSWIASDCLFRKQFPALPTTTPVIPAWQLQQNSADRSADADSAESRAETKSPTTVVENCENRTDTEPSSTASAETSVISDETTETVKDALENTQIVEVRDHLYTL